MAIATRPRLGHAQQTVTVEIVEDRRLVARYEIRHALPARLAACPKLKSLAGDIAVEYRTVRHFRLSRFDAWQHN